MRSTDIPSTAEACIRLTTCRGGWPASACRILFAMFAATALVAPPARAQDGPGTRAAGMGEAFVAVADDASAVYWNPAGLASGPFFNMQVDFGRGEWKRGTPGVPPAGGGRGDVRLVALGVPPLGFGYYRLSRVTTGASPAVPDGDGRQEGGQPLARLTTTHVGLTLLQSVGTGLVVGTTLKLVRGSLATGDVSGRSWTDVLDGGADLDASARTRADLDVGVMLNAGRVRLGLVARNLREPDFSPDGESLPGARLERDIRIGAAWGAMWPGLSPLVASVDADLTRVTDIDGERRDVAAGLETWWLGRRLGVRGGWRASTVGEARAVGTMGASVAVAGGMYVDAHLARGHASRQAWSVGIRMTY